MDLTRPASALGIGPEAEVLAVLAGTTKPLSGRAIARLVARGSERSVQQTLGRLAQQGLVDTVEAPPARLYTFNREHLAAPIALEIVDLRSALIDRLRSTIAGWSVQPAHASLFGSAARGDGTVRSDIDLLIVRKPQIEIEHPEWRQQIDNLAVSVERWTGNVAGISDRGSDDVSALIEAERPIVHQLVRDSIVLAGPEFSQMARRRTKRRRSDARPLEQESHRPVHAPRRAEAAGGR